MSVIFILILSLFSLQAWSMGFTQKPVPHPQVASEKRSYSEYRYDSTQDLMTERIFAGNGYIQLMERESSPEKLAQSKVQAEKILNFMVLTTRVNELSREIILSPKVEELKVVELANQFSELLAYQPRFAKLVSNAGINLDFDSHIRTKSLNQIASAMKSIRMKSGGHPEIFWSRLDELLGTDLTSFLKTADREKTWFHEIIINCNNTQISLTENLNRARGKIGELALTNSCRGFLSRALNVMFPRVKTPIAH